MSAIKILKKTDSVLHIRLPAFHAFGVLLLGFVLFTFWLGPLTVHLEGARGDNNAASFEITKRWFGIQISDRRVDGVTGAELQTSLSRDRDNHTTRTTYRAALTTEHGPEPITKTYRGGSKSSRQIVSRVQQFIENPSAETVSLRLKGLWALTLVGLFFLFLSVQLLSDRVDCVIDREAGQVTIHRGGLIGRGVCSFDLSEASHFEVEQTGLSGSKRGKVYRLMMVFKGGETFPFRHTWTNEWRSKKAAARQLTQFLQRSNPQPHEQHRVDVDQGEASKICVLCGRDCSDTPRVSDEANHYYHRVCYEAAQNKSSV